MICVMSSRSIITSGQGPSVDQSKSAMAHVGVPDEAGTARVASTSSPTSASFAPTSPRTFATKSGDER